MYRRPIDELEQATTGEADKILVNSEFTSEVFVRTFRQLGRVPRTVYPCVDYESFGKDVQVTDSNKWLLR
jgi:alpha-1,3/alpha-1,6-mannosyltransferase